MRRTIVLAAISVCGALAMTGCSSYTWTSGVPDDMRTIAVPTMRNESDVTELGSVMTRQVLRELQREGSFKIRRPDDSALEIQGVVKRVSYAASGYDRRGGLRTMGFDMTAIVEVSLVDKKNGRVLIDNRKYTAGTTFVASQDRMTAARDASGRLADDLARQVVDDILNCKWKGEKGE